MEDSDLLSYGTIYQNTRLIDVPGSYLLNLRRKANVPQEVLDYIEDNLDILAKEAKINEFDIFLEGLKASNYD